MLMVRVKTFYILKFFAMARTMGREDDVLCINYMTGARDVFGPQEKKLSNTLNPFSSGSSGGLTELLVSLMDDGGGGGDMWKGRYIFNFCYYDGIGLHA